MGERLNRELKGKSQRWKRLIRKIDKRIWILKMRQIAQGAEAKLYLSGSKVIKDRIKKDYRLSEIDERLRKSRTRREAKIFDKLAMLGFPSPGLIETDDKEKIVMEFISGPKVRDVIEKEDYLALSEEIGSKVAILHNHSIIHGDLTTSNMLLNREIYFIDFGLSFFSHKAEDKAVDLHLLKQALESRHHRIWEKSFNAVLEGYKKKAHNSCDILKRLENVGRRGRYKGKRFQIRGKGFGESVA